MEETGTTKWLVAAMAALALVMILLAVAVHGTDGRKGGDIAAAVESVLKDR